MWRALVSFPDLVNCSSITEESTGTSKRKLTWNTCYETVKKETISKHTFHQANYGSHLTTCTSSILKNKHQTELQTDEQHQIETKNTDNATADTSAENYRTRCPRDRRESVCWTWLGHWFFILIFDSYIDIWNETIYTRIKVLIKFVCKLPFTFYFYSLIQFFNFRTKIPLRPWKTAIDPP